MICKKVPQLIIPLSPYLQPTQKKPKKFKRIRPHDALDLRSMVKEINRSAIIPPRDIGGKPWSVVAVYSPYSLDVHVMVIETSSNRYLPGPEWVSEKEGDLLMKLWGIILDFIAERSVNSSVHLGYNWSPRAWGEEEEKTGLQSIPTKWHAMLWGWPSLTNEGQDATYLKWLNYTSLSLQEKRLMGTNNYLKPFAEWIKTRLKQTLPNACLFNQVFDFSQWEIDDRGLFITFTQTIQDMLRTPGFFSQILKPITEVLEKTMRELTQAMTTVNCVDMDKILMKTEQCLLSPKDMNILRAAPKMREGQELREAANKIGCPDCLIKAIRGPVRARCEESDDRVNWWRKGFGYALVLNRRTKGSDSELRIMPMVFVGPGGVVEAQGVILQRPENKQISKEKMIEKGYVLERLGKQLSMSFTEYVES